MISLVVLTTISVSRVFSSPLNAPNFFPIGVWLQAPTNAAQFQAVGINTFVGLWQGPTQSQLDTLQTSGLRLICHQTSAALQHPYRTNIIAWLQTDEPDNSQGRGARLGFGRPIPPEQIIAEYQKMKATDPSRPVFLNLGQGVAWDNWHGRGQRNRHPEDYPRYLEGCDIASFDIYPANHPDIEVAGNLWYVARGVTRLRQWARDTKPVWSFIECTTIDVPGQKPTPTQVRAQVWMSLIHGSRGIVYFVHQFQPFFREAALLDDPAMLAAVAAINQQITALAPVLNSPTITNSVIVKSRNPALPVATMTKPFADQIYLFAVAMRPLEGDVEFELIEKKAAQAEVLGEGRLIDISNGKFTDRFKPWEVHLYRIAEKRIATETTPQP